MEGEITPGTKQTVVPAHLLKPTKYYIFWNTTQRACPHYYWQIAKQPKWSIEVRATQLAGLLTGKAIAAYANLLKLLNHMRQSFKRPEELYHNWGD